MFAATWARQRCEPNLLKGTLAGLVGGLAASWVMTRFQSVASAEAFEKLLGEKNRQNDSTGDGQPQQSESEPATVQAAEAVSETAFDHALTDDEKKWAGPAVHYSFGSSAGALYGALAEVEPRITAAAGLPFGTVFWLIADEGAVPALGLSDPPWEHPPSTHVYAFVSHLVYGLTAETVRHLVRRML